MRQRFPPTRRQEKMQPWRYPRDDLSAFGPGPSERRVGSLAERPCRPRKAGPAYSPLHCPWPPRQPKPGDRIDAGVTSPTRPQTGLEGPRTGPDTSAPPGEATQRKGLAVGTLHGFVVSRPPGPLAARARPLAKPEAHLERSPRCGPFGPTQDLLPRGAWRDSGRGGSCPTFGPPQGRDLSRGPLPAGRAAVGSQRRRTQGLRALRPGSAW